MYFFVTQRKSVRNVIMIAANPAAAG